MSDKLTASELAEIGNGLADRITLTIRSEVKAAFKEHREEFCQAHSQKLDALKIQIEQSRTADDKVTLKGRVDEIGSNQKKALVIGSLAGAGVGFLVSSMLVAARNWIMHKLGFNP